MKSKKMALTLILLMPLLALPILAQAVTDGLVAYWAFDENDGEVASDSSGNGHDGTLVGDPQWVEGQMGSALHFDSSWR